MPVVGAHHHTCVLPFLSILSPVSSRVDGWRKLILKSRRKTHLECGHIAMALIMKKKSSFAGKSTMPWPLLCSFSLWQRTTFFPSPNGNCMSDRFKTDLWRLLVDGVRRALNERVCTVVHHVREKRPSPQPSQEKLYIWYFPLFVRSKCFN